MENGINQGKYIIKEIDVGVIKEIREKYKELEPYMTFIFLDIPTDSIRERMLLRGDDVSGEDYKNRVESSLREHTMMYLSDYIVDSNRYIDFVYQEVLDIMQSIIKKEAI